MNYTQFKAIGHTDLRDPLGAFELYNRLWEVITLDITMNVIEKVTPSPGWKFGPCLGGRCHVDKLAPLMWDSE